MSLFNFGFSCAKRGRSDAGDDVGLSTRPNEHKRSRLADENDDKHSTKG